MLLLRAHDYTLGYCHLCGKTIFVNARVPSARSVLCVVCYDRKQEDWVKQLALSFSQGGTKREQGL